MRRLLVAGLVVCVAAVATGSAVAATYTESCPSPSAYTAEPAIVAAQSCAVQSERLEAINAQLEDDDTRLDATWYGVWLLAGLVLVLLIAPLFVRAFRFWQ